MISALSVTWSVYDQPSNQCMIANWSVHDQSRDTCVISHVISACYPRDQCRIATWSLHDPPSVGFSRQEYWSGLPFPPPGVFLTQELSPCHLCLLHCKWILYPLGRLHSEPPGKLQPMEKPKWTYWPTQYLKAVFWFSFFYTFFYSSLAFNHINISPSNCSKFFIFPEIGKSQTK